ncbi:heme-binding protein [Dasania sp. GY-MA-18]|uniref:Heme-binding protein n=1 Tax=Dasania phycosphaerae TaxID=2950436 RepID=A0A9J6RMJ9_9GAMM|nr:MULTISPECIES: heme-binding protein [Dasania]MCR8923113.1 heme-binding protein [Dasania sp. GY-MA-18]MCZ0865545.1 heme-binding protein [Dasania phycosphaerae]MCZ0869270.1 heme-binding protein [Dasania phycosphaerae]
MKTVAKLTLDDARIMMAAAEKKALAIGVDMDIAIVDDGGNLLMFQRMDGARITSIHIAIDKAFTAAAARKSTRAYGETSGPGQPTFGLNVSHQGRFMIVAGGLPVFVNGDIVAGIGCSSGSPDQDEDVAQAGIEALEAAIA